MIKSNLPLILASKSPRRKKLLEQIGLEFEIIASDFDEDSIEYTDPENYSKFLATAKAKRVAETLENPSVVIGADTIVVLENQVMNKPANEKDAIRMLKLLSGKAHSVYTAVAFVRSSDMYSKSYVKKTEVTFRTLDESEILQYVKSGSPLDKAGSYGIQDDYGAVFVKHIEGCYYNIVGLPLELFYSELNNFLKNEL